MIWGSQTPRTKQTAISFTQSTNQSSGVSERMAEKIKNILSEKLVGSNVKSLEQMFMR